MESSIVEVLEELESALENSVPHNELIDWINEFSLLSSAELDTLVGLLEEKGYDSFALLLSEEIDTPTLENDLERQRPWHQNDRCNKAPADEIKYLREKMALQLFKTLRPDDRHEGEQTFHANIECRRFHNDL
tara:strand:+ start:1819 stop:2217 length:399 start_codon:yes stop_codon:yes gene_type:complete